MATVCDKYKQGYTEYRVDDDDHLGKDAEQVALVPAAGPKSMGGEDHRTERAMPEATRFKVFT